MENIIDSYFNGQFDQLVRQIDEYGLRKFVLDLDYSDYGLTHLGKYSIIRKYFLLKPE
jgi:hypothetical protein